MNTTSNLPAAKAITSVATIARAIIDEEIKLQRNNIIIYQNYVRHMLPTGVLYT